MFSEGFQLELKRLFTLFCGQESWLCWTNGREHSFRIAPSLLSEASLEERVLIRQLAFGPDGTTTLNSHHALFQLAFVNDQLSANHTVFLRFTLDQQLIILACPATLLPLRDVAQAFIQNSWKEWKNKQHLAAHLAQQEERIERVEARLEALQDSHKKHLAVLLGEWTREQLPLHVELEANLQEAFLQEFSETAIRKQLDATLAMLQFIQPAETLFYLRKSAIVTLDKTPPVRESTTLTSHQRAVLLLDKYEESAHLAQRKGSALNGKTIAEHLQPPISPPAITDALKKNRKAISALIQQHPEKWPLLRKYLKPVKELNDRYQYASSVF